MKLGNFFLSLSISQSLGNKKYLERKSRHNVNKTTTFVTRTIYTLELVSQSSVIYSGVFWAIWSSTDPRRTRSPSPTLMDLCQNHECSLPRKMKPRYYGRERQKGNMEEERGYKVGDEMLCYRVFSDNVTVHSIRDKKLRANMKALESKYKNSVLKLKEAEILQETTPGFLEPEHDLEKTYKVQQRDIYSEVNVETAKKGKFELKLDQLGPYVVDYTRNGRHLLLAGRKGHVATMDWREGKLGCELQLGETVRDAKWLHNQQMFAVAQKKYVYIYDHTGVELHCLKKHIEVSNMEFLPYHYLLATVVCRNLTVWKLEIY